MSTDHIGVRVENEVSQPIPPEPPVAYIDPAGTARSAQGRARFWRGGANPCARAPFWHLSTDAATGGAGGVGGPILLVGFERDSGSVFLPPFHRAPEAERFRSSFDDVRPICDSVQQRFAESWIRKHGRPLGKR
jgi:hypothetical protein